MMQRFRLSVLTPALFAVLCTSACTIGTRTVEEIPQVRLSNTPARFAGHERILSGYNIAHKRDAWRPGDTVLLGIALTRNDNVRVRYLKIRLTQRIGPPRAAEFSWWEPQSEGPPISPTYAAELTLYDEQFREIERSVAWVPWRWLGYGLGDIAEFLIDQGGEARLRLRTVNGHAGSPETDAASDRTLSPAEQRAYKGLEALLSFGEGTSRNRVARGLLADMLTLAQKFSLLFQIVDLDVVPMGLSRQHLPGSDSRDLYTVPIVVRFGDWIVLKVTAHAVRPDAPLGLTGGVLWLEGMNTIDPDRKIELRVLAAQRGSTADTE